MSLRLWKEYYDEHVKGPNTVECEFCGRLLLGDEPKILIICFKCWKDWEKKYYSWLSKDERPKRGSLDEDIHKSDWIFARLPI